MTRHIELSEVDDQTAPSLMVVARYLFATINSVDEAAHQWKPPWYIRVREPNFSSRQSSPRLQPPHCCP